MVAFGEKYFETSIWYYTIVESTLLVVVTSLARLGTSKLF